MKYNVFHRTWWKENPGWYRGMEPQMGKKHYLAHGVSYDEARKLCADYNETHAPGRLSDKAEFEEA
jgi:hypothetical protein